MVACGFHTAAAAAPPRPPDSGVAVYAATLCSVLNEKQRRLFGGFLALQYGYGGDRHAAALLGLHRKTVSEGRRELATGESELSLVRKLGGGRKSLQEEPLDDRRAAAACQQGDSESKASSR